MLKNYKNLSFFLIGVIFTILLIFGLNKFTKFADDKQTSNYYVLKNQITKMNKMVVLEQNFSSIQRTKVTYEILGNKISENQVITYTKTNAQVSYDLNKMKIEVDSVNKKLIIEKLPEPEIKIIPSVEITGIDDSFFNRVDEEQIKKITQTAKENAIKGVNKNVLNQEAKKQLTENLNQIFVLAKALNYEIEDRTNTLTIDKL